MVALANPKILIPYATLRFRNLPKRAKRTKMKINMLWMKISSTKGKRLMDCMYIGLRLSQHK